MNRLQGLGATLLIFIGGCSGGEDTNVQAPPKQDQLFQVQADALEKAKGVEQMLQDAADKQRLMIEEQAKTH
tara:strand:- start:81 stop:296 length:216 start_codon:yes stop_codon:yes gene_type:complete